MSIPVKTKLNWPVSLDEAKRHLRVDADYHDDDDYIQDLIYAATAKAEQYIGKDISETTNVQQLFGYAGSELSLDEGNLLSFTSAYTDTSTLLTVKETHTYYNSFLIEFNESPSSDPLTVSYKTGYSEGTCPALIKQAILLQIANFYDVDRLSYANGSLKETKAFERLLDSYRLIIF
jgi:hypothetical protein